MIRWFKAGPKLLRRRPKPPWKENPHEVNAYASLRGLDELLEGPRVLHQEF
jgi:hypothetical protein